MEALEEVKRGFPKLSIISFDVVILKISEKIRNNIFTSFN
jgi:hypothetical protein